MPTCCDDRLTPVALAFLTGLRDGLEDCDAPACRVSLVPGVEAVDDVCCKCCAEDGSEADGQAWVRVARIFPTGRFPAPMMERSNCVHEWAAVIELGIVRCMHTMSDDGSPPCADDLDSDALKTLRDAAILRSVVDCVGRELFDECSAFVPGEWTPRGPAGGCGGGTMSVTVSFRHARGCTDDD